MRKIMVGVLLITSFLLSACGLFVSREAVCKMEASDGSLISQTFKADGSNVHEFIYEWNTPMNADQNDINEDEFARALFGDLVDEAGVVVENTSTKTNFTVKVTIDLDTVNYQKLQDAGLAPKGDYDRFGYDETLKALKNTKGITCEEK
ncbi:MAG: hypothetical protein ACK5KR_04580 [Breznakia sp.]